MSLGKVECWLYYYYYYYYIFERKLCRRILGPVYDNEKKKLGDINQ